MVPQGDRHPAKPGGSSDGVVERGGDARRPILASRKRTPSTQAAVYPQHLSHPNGAQREGTTRGREIDVGKADRCPRCLGGPAAVHLRDALIDYQDIGKRESRSILADRLTFSPALSYFVSRCPLSLSLSFSIYLSLSRYLLPLPLCRSRCLSTRNFRRRRRRSRDHACLVLQRPFGFPLAASPRRTENGSFPLSHIHAHTYTHSYTGARARGGEAALAIIHRRSTNSPVVPPRREGTRSWHDVHSATGFPAAIHTARYPDRRYRDAFYPRLRRYCRCVVVVVVGGGCRAVFMLFSFFSANKNRELRSLAKAATVARTGNATTLFPRRGCASAFVRFSSAGWHTQESAVCVELG